MNGGPEFQFTEAISFYVNCHSQDEVDHFWEKLSTEGEQGQCGWLKDKFGISWQIVPQALLDFLGDPDAEKSARVTQAMLQMGKIDIDVLRQASDRS